MFEWVPPWAHVFSIFLWAPAYEAVASLPDPWGSVATLNLLVLHTLIIVRTILRIGIVGLQWIARIRGSVDPPADCRSTAGQNEQYPDVPKATWAATARLWWRRIGHLFRFRRR